MKIQGEAHPDLSTEARCSIGEISRRGEARKASLRQRELLILQDLQMAPQPETFSYRSRSSLYLSSAVPLSSIVLLEAAVLILVVVFAAPAGILRVLLSCAGVALVLFVLSFALAPLFTRHQLSETHLLIHYGFTRLEIPRSLIVSAEAVEKKLGLTDPLKAEYRDVTSCVVACFSEQGQILLTLKEGLPAPLGPFKKTVQAREILFNADRRDDLLAGLKGCPAERPEAPGVGDRELRSKGTDQTRPVETLPIKPMTALAGTSAIQTVNLTRRYGDFQAVDGLGLDVRAGEIYGFLGVNGAGKTTTLKMLSGIMEPSSGTAIIAGHDVWRSPLAAKRQTGYLADTYILYDRLTGREFLQFLARMRQIPAEDATQRIASLLGLLELSHVADRLCETYSHGMKRRLGLAGALLHQPAVLLLDEPFNGIDPRGARRLKDLMRQLASGGATVFLSTHDLSTAESVCDRVGILHQGRLIAEGTSKNLRELASAPDLESVFLRLTGENRQDFR